MQWQKKKNKKEIGVTGSNYPQSQHNSPALNCPLKKSTEFTPLPLHCEHRIAPACPLYTEFIYIYIYITSILFQFLFLLPHLGSVSTLSSEHKSLFSLENFYS
jgi:hypothetical protein